MRTILGLISVWLALATESPAQQVAIRADFPGGNVLVLKNEGKVIDLAPDLRGGPPWFYWHFEAEAIQPGEVNFQFAKPPMIGSRGPAVSDDAGRSWRWLGTEGVAFAPSAAKGNHDRFTFAFTRAGQKVRFAVAIPYLQRDLHEFLDRHARNPYLQRSILTKSRLGKRDVDLIQIGKPGPGVHAVLLTARHHACESMASFVLEGFLQEALSESPSGIEFRRKYVLHAVPIVDVDGVEMGDQGKNRLPRDYNRDYGDDAIHPEVKAIADLAELRQVRLSLDLHCPFLRGDIHDAFHFLGYGAPHIKDNLKEWSAWLKEERPQLAMVPVDLLVDPRKPNALDRRINSHYFATRKGALFAATLEVPYTQPQCPLDPELARAYGVGMLRAWVRTSFIDAEGSRTEEHATLANFRSQFLKSYRSKPREAEESAQAFLRSTAAVHRVEAQYLLATLRLHEKRFAEALALCDSARRDEHATTYQVAAATLLRLRVMANDPGAKADTVASALEECRRLAYPAPEQHAQALEIVGEFHQRVKDFESALQAVREQFTHVATWEKGRLLNRSAGLLELLGRKEEAEKTRKEAVKLLRERLGSKPERSVFGARMTFDLFEALAGISTTTSEELRAAGDMVLHHEIASKEMKDTVRRVLAK